MAYGYGTGPSGMGRGTGCQFGYCRVFDYPGYVVGHGRVRMRVYRKIKGGKICCH
jgi:hypothetical protein